MGQIRDLMTSSPASCESSTSVVDAAKTMAQSDVGPIPVVEGDRLVGIVAQADVALVEKEKKTGEVVQAISGS